jgi:hypothetical protein
MVKIKIYGLSLVVLTIVLPIAGCWFTADALPLSGPLILQLADDNVVLDGTAQLSHYIDDAHVIRIHNVFELFRTVQKAIDQIFYVGHGTAGGLEVGNGIVSWSEADNLLGKTIAKEHYFVACFSHFEHTQYGKIVMGFDGIVDVDVAVNLVAAVSYGIHNNFDKWAELAQDFSDKRGFDKLFNPVNPLFSISTEILWGQTPYGVWNPPAVKTILTEAEVSQYGSWSTIATLLLGILGGYIGAALAAYTGGFAWSLSQMWAHDKQGTYPNMYIVWWIPMDPANVLLMNLNLLWFFATPRFWWGCTLSFGYIWCNR